MIHTKIKSVCPTEYRTFKTYGIILSFILSNTDFTEITESTALII